MTFWRWVRSIGAAMVDNRTVGFRATGQVANSRGGYRSDPREDVLLDQWSDRFSARLVDAVRSAVAKEIDGHEKAGRAIPVVPTTEVESARTEVSSEPDR